MLKKIAKKCKNSRAPVLRRPVKKREAFLKKGNKNCHQWLAIMGYHPEMRGNTVVLHIESKEKYYQLGHLEVLLEVGFLF